MESRVFSAKTKIARQEKIKQLISTGQIKSQFQLVSLLKKQGFNVTQATVSRDLDELKISKLKDINGKSGYVLTEITEKSTKALDSVKKILTEWVITVGSSANLVVIKTAPGSAHVVGSALDRANLKEILGTVAGDDTLLVILKEGYQSAQVAKFLLNLINRKEE
jgi:transcriptional regulator of arginine metabolism